MRPRLRSGADTLYRAQRRSRNARNYAAISDGRHSVDFDRIVEVMKQTGHDIPSLYKETAQGGLAAIK